jgi:hypothetical protein
MRKLIFLVLFLVLLAPAHSQVNEDFQFFRVYLLGGGSRWDMKWASWDRFAGSYNNGYNNSLSTQLGNFGPFPGWYAGAGFRLLVFGVEYSIYRSPDQVQSMVFKNGDRMEFQIYSKGYNMAFPIVMPVSKRASIGIDMGIKSLQGELHSRTVYANGTVSYGADQTSNGIFGFNNRWLIMIGPRFEFGKRLRGYVSLTWPMMNQEDVTGLQDKGADYGGIWSHQAKSVYLPEQWNNRENDQYYFVGYEPVLRDMKGMQVQFGMAFDIFKFNMF